MKKIIDMKNLKVTVNSDNYFIESENGSGLYRLEPLNPLAALDDLYLTRMELKQYTDIITVDKTLELKNAKEFEYEWIDDMDNFSHNKEDDDYMPVEWEVINEDEVKPVIDKAVRLLYEELNLDIDSIDNDYKHDYLSVCTARNGKEAFWYYDGTLESAIYIDTLEFLTADEIEKEFL